DGTLKLIQTLDQRLESIESLGIKYAVIVPFNQNFATLSSLEFVQKILKETLKVESAVVGENFRFGKDREGDISQLIRFGKRFGFRVHEISSVEKNGRRVSSSLIRSMLEAGSIEEANQFLGRNYEIRGKVVKGMSRGKALGFPTANIKSENEIVPPGVFISEAIIDNKKYLSMTNVGHRPTFGPEELHVESYLLNLKNDIYGKKISLSFIKKMREERKFTSVDQLATQLRKDLKMTKSYFKLQRR
ncbi:MAG: riboflavin biosynthesis protein RibF, partial [Candidatus Aminicenantales bacterium]